MSSVIGSSDLLTYYNDLYANGTTTTTSTSKLQSTLENTDYSTASSDELLEVCKDFEQYFVEQVIKQMEKMIPEDDEDSTTSKYLDYFGDTYTQALAEDIVDSNDGQGIGLAQTLYEQMKRNYGIE
jgi:flagellar protein FlgJ